MAKKILVEELELSSGVVIDVYGVSQLLLARLNSVVGEKYPDLEPFSIKTNVIPGDLSSPEQTIYIENLEHAEFIKNENPGLYGSLVSRFKRWQADNQTQMRKRGEEVVVSLFGIAVKINEEKTKANGLMLPSEDWIGNMGEYIKNTIEDYISYYATRTEIDFQMISMTIGKLTGSADPEKVAEIAKLFRAQMEE